MDLTENIAKQINLLYSKKYDPDIFSFEMLRGPDVYQLLPYGIVEHIHQYILDPKNSGDTKKKIEHIDEVLRPYGFKRFAGGTNRVVYGFLEDQSFCLKVAIDRIGITNNPDEFRNQQFLKPFVCKIFSVSPCGTIATVERVIPIRSRQEFAVNAGSVFDVIANKFVGKYILEDIGTIWFKNWGIRRGFGPVLLDYPYLYEVDLNSLFCNEMTPFGLPCGGQIDYDDGFNILYCTRCGKRHKAKQIGKAITDNVIMIKGGNSMGFHLIVKKGDKVIVDKTGSDTHIDPNKVKNQGVIEKPFGKETWRKEDFDVIMVLNGVKIGKKDGKTTILGESKAKATKLPSKDENPYKGFRTNVKEPKKFRNMPDKPEVPEWAKDDMTPPANKPGEKVVKKLDMSGFGSPAAHIVHNNSKLFSLKVHLPGEKVEASKEVSDDDICGYVMPQFGRQAAVLKSNPKDAKDDKLFSTAANNEEKTDGVTNNMDDKKSADSEISNNSEEPIEDEEVIESDNSESEGSIQSDQSEEPGDTSNSNNNDTTDEDDSWEAMIKAQEDLPYPTEEERKQMDEELAQMRAKQEAKKQRARNKIAEAYGFSEADYERTTDQCDEDDGSNRPNVSDY